ncbi:MAG TPA: hypothetical protein VM010_01745, partial [Chitinophagaceae bacterium]|nr:hypothetical protein [Chitinophagaceae bacterium]
ATVGGYSELIATGTTTAFGVRLGVGTALGKKYRSIHIQDVYRDHFLSFDYFNFTTHLTKNRYTGFLRINAATKASGALIGLNYRL